VRCQDIHSCGGVMALTSRFAGHCSAIHWLCIPPVDCAVVVVGVSLVDLCCTVARDHSIHSVFGVGVDPLPVVEFFLSSPLLLSLVEVLACGLRHSLVLPR
jgi:hypothetical protein